MLNIQQASNSGLYAAQRQLLKSEPPNHNPLECRDPQTCPACIQWRAWARELVQINREIAERESK